MKTAGLNPVLLELAFNKQFDVKRAFVPNPNAAASQPMTPEAQQASMAPPPGGDPAAGGGAPPMDPAMAGGAPPPPPGMDPAAAGGAPPMDPAAAGAAPPPEAAAPPPPPEPAPAAPAPPAGGVDPEMIRNIIREEMGGGGAGAKGKGKPKPGDEMALRNQKLLMNLHKSLNIPLPYDILDGEDGEQGGGGGGEKKPSGGGESKSAATGTGVDPSFRLGTLAQNIDATFRLHQLAGK